LSIGYSTCHWCHVMAHESFENERIAEILNEKFISIKVDREEMPGVDAVYMEFVQATTGSGGWPMTVFLTPDGKPFYGGTYFPPTDSYGRPGFESVLDSVDDAWRNRRDKILASVEEVTAALQQAAGKTSPLAIDVNMLDSAYQTLKSIYDPQYGGFGRAPKFPQPAMLSFLLVYADRTGDEKALEMLQHTLEKMATGGIYDHLGGGFHRYSVDQQWLVPHFEKMLYDQALISRVYTQALQLTGHEKYKATVVNIFDYVLRDMANSEGAFYSAEDADSEGAEGTFYVWTANEIEKILRGKGEKLMKLFYGVTESGNFEHGTNILYVAMPLSEAAKKSGINPSTAGDILNSTQQKLFVKRQQRKRPHRDEKIIAGWNGMMISSLAYGGAVLNEPKYILAAQKSANFVLEHLRHDSRLRRYYADGQSHEYAVLDDYVYLIRGMIDLYQADFDPKWIKTAIDLSNEMTALFGDKHSGGFYLTGSDTEQLFIRSRPDYDGAVPSGNSIAVENMIRLAELTGDKQWFVYAEKTLAYYQDFLKTHPTAMMQMLTSVDLWLGLRSEIVLSVPADASADEQLNHVRDLFLPRSVVLLKSSHVDISLLEALCQTGRQRPPVDGKVTVYLCEDFVCKQPITDKDVFQEALKDLQKN
ncbi:MAG: thioredoxin domain-containing protein, partial [Planctomycetota bacterium]